MVMLEVSWEDEAVQAVGVSHTQEVGRKVKSSCSSRVKRGQGRILNDFY